MQRYYTIKEASLILGFSTNTIYKFANAGRLQTTRGSAKQGRFRITHRALESFVGHQLSPQFIAQCLGHRATTPQPTTSPEVPAIQESREPAIPLTLTRGLIILSLLLILTDIFTSQDFSILSQLIRFTILGIIIVITYQFGGFRPDSA